MNFSEGIKELRKVTPSASLLPKEEIILLDEQPCMSARARRLRDLLDRTTRLSSLRLYRFHTPLEKHVQQFIQPSLRSLLRFRPLFVDVRSFKSAILLHVQSKPRIAS